MHSLATTVCIHYVCVVPGSDTLEAWDRRHQGGRTNRHPIRALHFQYRIRTLFLLHRKVSVYRHRFSPYTWNSFSHTAVTDMEIQFLYKNLTEKDPKLRMDHTKKTASREAPFSATTLSLVFDKLVKKTSPRPVPAGSQCSERVFLAGLYNSMRASRGVIRRGPWRCQSCGTAQVKPGAHPC